jgi:hypothetical protein
MLPQVNAVDEPCITSPISYFRELGNLHDTKLTEVSWKPAQHEIAIVVDDIYANFLGLPEYPGLQSAILIFSGVSKLQGDVESTKFLPRIMDFEIEEDVAGKRLCVTVNLESSGSIRVECQAIACRQISAA